MENFTKYKKKITLHYLKNIYIQIFYDLIVTKTLDLNHIDKGIGKKLSYSTKPGKQLYKYINGIL